MREHPAGAQEYKTGQRAPVRDAVERASACASSRQPHARVSGVEPRGAQEPTVAIQVVCGLMEAAHRIAGVPKSELLRAVQLGPEQLAASDARVPRALVFQLVQVALECSGDAALGLHWAERISEGSFVPLSALIPQAATLRRAFEVAAQFNRLLSDESSYELVELDDEVVLRRIEIEALSPPLQRFADEMMVGGVCRIVHHFCVDPAAVRVSFRFSAPPYAKEYERVLGHPPRFGQRFTGVVFARTLLDTPAPHRDGEYHAALSAHAEQRLGRMTRDTPYVQQVRELLLRHGPSQRSRSMGVVARALGLSARTLRRRLADEGTTYNLILHEALATVAKALLRDRQRTIEDVAYEMGFSDASTFHRAFKSWTGATPSSFRGDGFRT